MSKPMYEVGIFDWEIDAEKWMEERTVVGYVVESVSSPPNLYEGQEVSIAVVMRFDPDEALKKLRASVDRRCSDDANR